MRSDDRTHRPGKTRTRLLGPWHVGRAPRQAWHTRRVMGTYAHATCLLRNAPLRASDGGRWRVRFAISAHPCAPSCSRASNGSTFRLSLSATRLGDSSAASALRPAYADRPEGCDALRLLAGRSLPTDPRPQLAESWRSRPRSGCGNHPLHLYCECARSWSRLRSYRRRR